MPDSVVVSGTVVVPPRRRVRKPSVRKPKIPVDPAPLKNRDYTLIHGQDFQLAFEVEFVFNAANLSKELIQDTLQEWNSNIIVGHDGSIRPSRKFTREGVAEIKTPPLPSIQALELLKKIFNYVEQKGYTNRSCGLHLNFSPTSDNLYYALNPFTFTSEDIWEEIVKEFSRTDNDFCRKVWSTKPKNLLEIWEQTINKRAVVCGHYNVVNMAHYTPVRYNTSRVEIRGFGNLGYHKKFGRIVYYTERVFDTFLKNCSPVAAQSGVSSGVAAPSAPAPRAPILVATEF